MFVFDGLDPAKSYRLDKIETVDVMGSNVA